jgi:hypothetical protein
MKSWEQLAERSGMYSAADFQQAAYALMVQQALYATEQRQRTAYYLIKEHLSHFREAFDLFGVDLFEEPADQYIVAVPRHQRQTLISTDLTLLILTLAQVYRLQMTRGEIDGDRAVVTIEELRSAYKALSGRELPADAGSLKQLLLQTHRMGMSRMVDSDPGSAQPFDVAVLPGIKSLVSEATLMRFAAAYQSMNERRQDDDEEEAVSGGSDEAP